MSMPCVSHEKGIASTPADLLVFMDGGGIVDENGADAFFGNTRHRAIRRSNLLLCERGGNRSP